MPEPTIKDAIRLYEERKRASGVSGNDPNPQGEDIVRRVLSGLDLDFEELLDLRSSLAGAPMNTIAMGGGLPHVLVGQWVDGLATGLLLARLREEAD